MKISEKIAILRKRFGYSQEDLANELDISRQSIYKWETDNSTPDLDNIKKMANLFNVSFDKLLDDNIDITVEETVVKKEYISTKKKEYRNIQRPWRPERVCPLLRADGQAFKHNTGERKGRYSGRDKARWPWDEQRALRYAGA